MDGGTRNRQSPRQIKQSRQMHHSAGNCLHAAHWRASLCCFGERWHRAKLHYRERQHRNHHNRRRTRCHRHRHRRASRQPKLVCRRHQLNRQWSKFNRSGARHGSQPPICHRIGRRCTSHQRPSHRHRHRRTSQPNRRISRGHDFRRQRVEQRSIRQQRQRNRLNFTCYGLSGSSQRQQLPCRRQRSQITKTKWYRHRQKRPSRHIGHSNHHRCRCHRHRFRQRGL